MIVVNGQYPGPAIRAHEGDIVVVNVTNRVASPITIHWLKAQTSLWFSLILEEAYVWKSAGIELSEWWNSHHVSRLKREAQKLSWLRTA